MIVGDLDLPAVRIVHLAVVPRRPADCMPVVELLPARRSH
jgi:hypothetical protein